MLKKKRGCIAALVATVAAGGAMAFAAAPAGATVTPCTPAEEKSEICLPIVSPFLGYHVSGTFVTKGGGAGSQTIKLPLTGGAFPNTHPGFTGFAVIALRSPLLGVADFNQGSINSKCPAPPLFTGPFENPVIQFLLHPCGNISPPFTQEVEFPEKSGEHQVAGFTTEESPGESGCKPELPLCATPSGEFHTTAASNCPTGAGPGGSIVGKQEDCVHEEVGQSIRLGYSVHGPGNGTPSKTQSQCETEVPAKFTISDNLTLEEFFFVGSHFKGSFTTPHIKCGGKYAVGRGEQMSETFSGTTNYDICVQPVVPPESPTGAPPGSIKLEGCPQFPLTG